MDGSFFQPAQAILRGGKLSVLVAVITMFISYTRVLIIQAYFGKKERAYHQQLNRPDSNWILCDKWEYWKKLESLDDP